VSYDRDELINALVHDYSVDEAWAANVADKFLDAVDDHSYDESFIAHRYADGSVVVEGDLDVDAQYIYDTHENWNTIPPMNDKHQTEIVELPGDDYLPAHDKGVTQDE
jgi:hypothetical protein